MSIHPMTAADAAWYHMDGPANLAVVTGVLLTTQPVDFARVRKLFQDRLLGFERFRQRIQFGHQQRTAAGNFCLCNHAMGRGLCAMRGTEGIHNEYIAERRIFFR